jgi:superfamily II DNA or RNA helicase
MEENEKNIIKVDYQQTGQSTKVNELGMREMQAKAYAARNQKYLLIKAPPASGKSRALMFIALDKLAHQGIKRVIVAVPEMSIGSSFQDTKLKEFGFFADWKVSPFYNLCTPGMSADKTKRFEDFFKQDRSKVLLCAHATLRNGMKQIDDECMNDCLLAIDEFHHTSADVDSGLGDVVRRVMNHSTAHIVAMTGSYFRGDRYPVLRPEDEAKFYPVTYNYYEQLNGYKYLKNLILGYHFYHGSYLDHIEEALDTTKKTIIHIPSVNSRAAVFSKATEVDEIMKIIGAKREKDYNTCIYTVTTEDGRKLKVADLVEDEPKERAKVQEYLQHIKKREDMDIIIALNTAKEGFDWRWCEQCLTIGVRGSLTEIVQIVGRCTRDCEGKEMAKFTNMIAMPEADQADVKVAVNDFLKAIAASLLMEQVTAPNWNFRTAKDGGELSDERTIVVEGLKPLSSEATKRIVEEKLDDLKAAILQDDMVQKALSGSATAEQINKELIPKVIHERYPYLSEGETEEVRQRVILDTIFKGGTLVDENQQPINTDSMPSGSDSEESEGNRLLKVANRFINIQDLNINLIDSVNPFQRAYEILSKTIDSDTLRIIQNCVAAQQFDISLERAIELCKGPYQKYMETHGGNRPSVKDADPKVRELAVAFNYIKDLKIRHQKGLDYEPKNA